MLELNQGPGVDCSHMRSLRTVWLSLVVPMLSCGYSGVGEHKIIGTHVVIQIHEALS